MLQFGQSSRLLGDDQEVPVQRGDGSERFSGFLASTDRVKEIRHSTERAFVETLDEVLGTAGPKEDPEPRKSPVRRLRDPRPKAGGSRS